MGLYCMESLGRSYKMDENYKDFDGTYVLFEEVLLNYLPFANDCMVLALNDDDNKMFLGLEETYKTSKSEERKNQNDVEQMADSLAFYKSTGLIFMEKGNYYIDSKILKDTFLSYQDAKERKGKSYKMGSRK